MSTVSPKMENNHPLGFLGYFVFLVMDRLVRKFVSKELHECKRLVKQLEEERNSAVKFKEEELRDTQRFVEVLKKDNATLRKQLAEKNNVIKILQDYLTHILDYATETKQRTTLQQYMTDKIYFFDVYQNILGALSAIRYGTTNSGKTLKRRDSRKSLTEKNNDKKMCYEVICTNERLNGQLEQTQAELAMAKKQVENLKQDRITLQKRLSQDKTLTDGRIYAQLNRSAEQAEQYKNLLASYSFLENQFVNLKTDYDILVPYKENLRTALEAKNSYISNIRKVLTGFLFLKYLLHDSDSTYDRNNFVSHLAEHEDPAERTRYFRSFVEGIQKAVMQERETKLRQFDPKNDVLKLTAMQNKCENLQCLKEDAEAKCNALEQELKARELTEANLLKEYDRVCVMHSNVSAELKQKTRELEAFNAQAQENEDDLKKGLEQIKQDYRTIHEENVLLKSENEETKNLLHDLHVEKVDLLENCSCLENELIYAQNQLNQYKNPELMPSYQEVLRLYTEVRNVVDEAEHREKECADRNDVLTEQINTLSAENDQLRKSGPAFEGISAVYDDVRNVQNQQLLRDSEHANVKQVGQLYRKEIRRLDFENVKLLSALKDEQNGPKHRRFKHKLEKLKTEIKVIENIYEAGKLDQVVFNFEVNLHKIAAETAEILGKMSPENASSSQLARKYDELIDALKLEHERLQDCLRNKDEPSEVTQRDEEEEEEVNSSDSPYVSSSLKIIGKIRQNIRQLEMRVDNFQGSRKDKEYLDIEHKLLENIMAIDVIQVEGHEIIREKRRQTVMYANDCMKKLEENILD